MADKYLNVTRDSDVKESSPTSSSIESSTDTPKDIRYDVTTGNVFNGTRSNLVYLPATATAIKRNDSSKNKCNALFESKLTSCWFTLNK